MRRKAQSRSPISAPQGGSVPETEHPLEGLRVIEMPAIGPVPHAAMQLADLGATVVRVERPNPPHRSPGTVRGREAVTLDLRTETDVDHLWQLIDDADV